MLSICVPSSEGGLYRYRGKAIRDHMWHKDDSSVTKSIFFSMVFFSDEYSKEWILKTVAEQYNNHKKFRQPQGQKSIIIICLSFCFYLPNAITKISRGWNSIKKSEFPFGIRSIFPFSNWTPKALWCWWSMPPQNVIPT